MNITIASKRVANFFMVLMSTVICLACQSGSPTETERIEYPLYVYSNAGSTIHVIDYKKSEYATEIDLNFPDTLDFTGAELSTDRNYLIFRGYVSDLSNSNLHMANYNISKNTVEKIYSLPAIKSLPPPNYTAANLQEKSSLMFLYQQSSGWFSFDFMEGEIIEMISDFHDNIFSQFFECPMNEEWIAVNNMWLAGPGYTELKIYPKEGDLNEPTYILNKMNEDSIFVYDMVFNKTGDRLYVSFQTSGGISRETGESYFGYYDLTSKELIQSDYILPWSLNPYYIAYSPLREEVYVIGASDILYIFDSQSNTILDAIQISGKIPGPSLITITPDESTGFISCSKSDFVAVIDLESRSLKKKISVKHPYRLILP